MSPDILPGTGNVLLVCDHASNAVPAGIDLGIAPDLLGRHIAIDIGAGALTRALAVRIGAPAVVATVSRLVIDTNREVDHPTLIPPVSDGHPIPGNVGADRFDRIARFHAPYHRAIAARIRAHRPRLILGIHSFTPRLESAAAAADRPWQIGILSNRDRRAVGPALAFLAGQGLIVGDNQPYSGRVLNATLNRHGEGQGIASAGIEIRNDLLDDAAQIARWAEILAQMIAAVGKDLA
ncbi:N-formylglutamate amidohydrolase [Sphingomonas sp.]|uniref:N-formylglutamate amidohydrolase n=1 Tax=Sphingomonas sp. TaxID=28214 RepID=UPI002CD51AFB|nr:N-formylglutamate amidohydrolase [Sphingomonas sp.]HWK34747.1 N-formylglutamate amidohydrolase [Sphingomonas sp.]